MSRRIAGVGRLELVWRTDAAERIGSQLSRKGRPSIYDPASNWYEPWYFRLRLEEEILRSRRYSLEMAVLALTFAEVGGPLSPRRMELKSELRRIAQTSLRQTDLPGVLDGERFALCLPSTDREGAHVVAERLAVGLTPYSARLGLAIWPADGVDADDLLNLAFGHAAYHPLPFGFEHATGKDAGEGARLQRAVPDADAPGP
jgi:hypothetical protein